MTHDRAFRMALMGQLVLLLAGCSFTDLGCHRIDFAKPLDRTALRASGWVMGLSLTSDTASVASLDRMWRAEGACSIGSGMVLVVGVTAPSLAGGTAGHALAVLRDKEGNGWSWVDVVDSHFYAVSRADRGAYVAGTRGGDILLGRVDLDGSWDWLTTFGGSDGYELAPQIASTSRGVLVAARHWSDQLLIFEVSAGGVVLWEKRVPVAGAWSVQAAEVLSTGELRVTVQVTLGVRKVQFHCLLLSPAGQLLDAYDPYVRAGVPAHFRGFCISEDFLVGTRNRSNYEWDTTVYWVGGSQVELENVFARRAVRLNPGVAVVLGARAKPELLDLVSLVEPSGVMKSWCFQPGQLTYVGYPVVAAGEGLIWVAGGGSY